jgi:hypothetical protein
LRQFIFNLHWCQVACSCHVAYLCPQSTTLDELTALKAALALEREERIAEDDEIVQVRAREASMLKNSRVTM